MNYTKGSWFKSVWSYSEANPPRMELVIQNDTNRIAVLDWDQGQDNPYTISDDEAQANASLISAAPDMYEALKSFLALCPSSEGLGGHAPIEAFFVIADKARNAIAKAEGRSEE